MPIVTDNKELNSYICALETRSLSYVHSRVYFDATIGASNLPNLRGNVSKIGNRVIGELKSQIVQTSWINEADKTKAVDKFSQLKMNLLVDDNSLKDPFLDTFYGDYIQPNPITPSTVLDTVRKFMLKKELSLLGATTISQKDFVGSSTDVS